MKINYEYLSNGCIARGAWECDPSQALAEAVEYLGAEYDPEAEAWIYQAPETGELVLVDEDALLEAGAAILGGASDWYSPWCAEYGAPVGR